MAAIDRILAELAAPQLVEALGDLTPNDLTSVLLAVAQRRASRVTLKELMNERPLLAPSSADARRLALFDRLAFDAASDFEAIALSPVAPLGANSVLGGIHQNNALATVRNAQAVADPTTSMALEIARRRKAQAARRAEVRLCTSARCIRMQPVDVPGFTPHFALFAMATAGRDSGNQRFEHASLIAHLEVYLRLFSAMAQSGFSLGAVKVELSDPAVLDDIEVDRGAIRRTVRAHRVGAGAGLLEGKEPRATERLHLAEQEVLAPLRARYPSAQFGIDLQRLEGVGYYSGLTFRISVAHSSGQVFPLADGGFVDWTQRLLADRKERLLTSGIGAELCVKMF